MKQSQINSIFVFNTDTLYAYIHKFIQRYSMQHSNYGNENYFQKVFDRYANLIDNQSQQSARRCILLL
uniref:Uncharacterized protein n=1 Tax=Pseudoalteromonas rubra TaxID=43658 RepID=A0A0F4QLK5_9GAMM|nr:hypothetical protein TW77_15100 [Pseudoalteromonas rubra]